MGGGPTSSDTDTEMSGPRSDTEHPPYEAAGTDLRSGGLLGDEESVDVQYRTSDAMDGDVSSRGCGQFANVPRIRGDHRMVPANSTLDNGDVNDVVVIRSSRQGPYCTGVALGEILDGAALQEARQIRLRTAPPAFSQHSRRNRRRQPSAQSSSVK